jgi:hypothetical protein
MKNGKTTRVNGGAWSGTVELRGLPANKTFHVIDYVHHQDFGNVTGSVGKLEVKFTDNLLLEATPVP